MKTLNHSYSSKLSINVTTHLILALYHLSVRGEFFQTRESRDDVRLVGSVIETVNTRSSAQCIARCIQSTACESVNTFVESSRSVLCELNSESAMNPGVSAYDTAVGYRHYALKYRVYY